MFSFLLNDISSSEMQAVQSAVHPQQCGYASSRMPTHPLCQLLLALGVELTQGDRWRETEAGRKRGEEEERRGSQVDVTPLTYCG